MIASDTYHIVNAMRRAGNVGVIQQWKESVANWAQINRTDPNAAAVNAWLPFWQPRPFYTVEELAPMWPALAIATGYTDKWPVRQSMIKSPARLEFELDFHKLPRLPHCRRYFICERIHFWQHADEHKIMQELQHALG
jgi:hypothetical protein